MSMEERKNKNSDARIRANNKYNDKAYDRINIAVPKGYKATIKEIADTLNESINEFVKTSIKERIDRINKKNDDKSFHQYLQKLEEDKQKEDSKPLYIEKDIGFDDLI